MDLFCLFWVLDVAPAFASNAQVSAAKTLLVINGLTYWDSWRLLCQ